FAKRWVDDLEAVANALGLARFPILGLCQDSAIAVAFAARHPERVSRLVICGGYVQGAVARDSRSEAAREVKALAQRLRPDGDARRRPSARSSLACSCRTLRRKSPGPWRKWNGNAPPRRWPLACGSPFIPWTWRSKRKGSGTHARPPHPRRW